MPTTRRPVADLLPGHYGVVSGSGFVSSGIKLSTRSPWSHAFVVIEDGKTIEAGGKGAFIGSVSDHHEHHLAFNLNEPLTDEQRASIVSYAHSLVGVPYGYVDIALLAVKCWTGHTPKHLIARYESERALICSQLVARCYAHAGITLCPGKLDALVTPGDLGLRPTVVIDH